MTSSSSKPLRPRDRKLKRDRLAEKKAKSSSASKPNKGKATTTKPRKKPRTASKKFIQEETGGENLKPARNSQSTKTRSASKRYVHDDEPRKYRNSVRGSDSPKPRSRPERTTQAKGKKSQTSQRPSTPPNSHNIRVTPGKKRRTVAAPVVITESWSSLGVHPHLIKLLSRDGITEPFAIQQATLPDALAGNDVLGRAQTGSGKTLAFGLAMLTRLASRKAKPRQPLALVLVPTRELAMQVTDALTPLSHAVDLDIRLIAGGMPYAKQIEALRRGVPILVSTPGRLSDLVNQGHADLSRIEHVILDEADQMCDMGFMPQIVEILDLVPPKGQRLLFSATLDGDVDRLVHRYLKDPVLHETSAVGASVTTMEHHVFIVERNQREDVLAHIAAREGKTIMFVRTQAAADRIAHELAEVGIPVGALHGGKSQNLRTRTINDFRNDVTNVLVATDVAARGIHVDGISLVVHVDPPTDPKDYLHRSGRTARAGDEGRVITIIGPRQQRSVLGMLDKVGVQPTISRMTVTSTQLVDITGAREPSGQPWKLPKSAKPSGNRSGQRNNRSGGPGARRRTGQRPRTK